MGADGSLVGDVGLLARLRRHSLSHRALFSQVREVGVSPLLVYVFKYLEQSLTAAEFLFLPHQYPQRLLATVGYANAFHPNARFFMCDQRMTN